MILESVEHGSLIWPTIEENRVTRTKKYAELSVAEKIQADCDLKATNIILKGLPSDIFSHFNHHIVAKDLWERIQLLMQAKAVLMANLSSYISDVLFVVPHSENTHNDMLNQIVQETPYSEQTHLEKEAKDIDKEITLEKKVKELNTIVCKMGQSAQTVHMLTKPQVFYDNNLKQALGFQNPFYLKKAQQIRPTIYDGSVIAKNSPEFQDTANSGPKKETKAMVFYQMDTKEVSDRFVAPCFVNRTKAYDGNKVVKKELIVALRGKIYFVKFIIYPEDDVEPGVIYEKEKRNDDCDRLVDFNIDDIPLLGEEGILPLVCKMRKSSRNKKRTIENLSFFYQDIGISSSGGGHLTQEEAAKEGIKDKVELDGKIVKEEEDAVKRIKGEALQEKDDLGAFIFPIRLEGQVNENTLADTGSDINTMPYRIYETLGREDMKKVDRGITMINHTQAEAMGILTNVLCRVGVTTLIAKFLILDILNDRDSLIVVGRGFMRIIGGIVNTSEKLFSTFDGFCHQTFCDARSDVVRNAKSDSDDEEDYQIKRNKFGAPIVWKKAVSFLGSLPVPLKNVNWKPDYKGSLWEYTMMRPDHQDPNTLDNMKSWKSTYLHHHSIHHSISSSRMMSSVEMTQVGSSIFDTDKFMAQMDAMTMKIDAQYKEFQSHSKQLNLDHNDDDIPMSRKEENKFMQTFRRTRFYNDYHNRDSNRDNWRSNGRNDYNRDNYQSNFDGKPDL
nr:hypothetical protein [Tanacetum cinerariifolium]